MSEFPFVAINDSFSDFNVEKLVNELPEFHKNHVNEIRNPKLKLQSLAARLLLQTSLRDIFGIEKLPDFAFSEHKKPYFAQFPNIHFNLSHCDNAVGCALNIKPIGFDIEKMRTFNRGVAERVFNDIEIEKILESDCAEEIFTEFWTVKESIAKLTGSGISVDLRNIIPNFSEQVDIKTIKNADKQYFYSVATWKSNFSK